jgi:hypothetical protein
MNNVAYELESYGVRDGDNPKRQQARAQNVTTIITCSLVDFPATDVDFTFVGLIATSHQNVAWHSMPAPKKAGDTRTPHQKAADTRRANKAAEERKAQDLLMAREYSRF